MTARDRVRLLIVSISVLLCLGALTAAAAAPRHAPNPASASDAAGTLRIRPQPARVDAGGTVTVQVWLENAGNYYGMDFKIVFEKAKVSVPSGNVTLLWEVFDPDNHFAIKNSVTSVDATHSQVWYSVTNLIPAEPFTGTGRLCSITFSGIAEGTTLLDFTYAKGSTRDGGALYPTQVDGAIVVGQMYRSRLPVVAVQ